MPKRNASSRPGTAYYGNKRTRRIYAARPRRRRRYRARRPMFKRRTYRRRTYRRRRRMPYSISKRGFLPRTTTRVLTYATTFSMDAAAGSYAQYAFRLNSLYDPDLTGTGHQPFGFDEMMAYYQRYTVIGAKVSCSFDYRTDADSTQKSWVCSYLEDTDDLKADTPTSYQDFQEMPGIQFRESNPDGAVILNRRVGMKKFFRTKGILPQSGQDFSGTSTTNPARGCDLYFRAVGHDSANEPDAVYGSIKIEYLTVFTEPLTIGAS